MNISLLTENIWRFYNDGRNEATRQTLREADILQMVKMDYSRRMRELYYASKKIEEGDEYYFFSGILSVKRFPLGDADMKGKRRADMSKEDLYRLPKNSDSITVYPIGCNGTEGVSELTQVQPGEEVFYAGNAEFQFFKFYAYKGKGIDTYNLPPCAKSIDVEATFDDADIDIPLDIAFEIASDILGISLRIPGFAGKGIDNSFEPPKSEQLRRQLQQAQPIE